MGQYYEPSIVTRKGNPYVIFPKCYDYGMGAKLMEHSYFNYYVGCVIDYLINNPKSRLVWGGDYADSRLKLYNKEEHKWCECNTYDKVCQLRYAQKGIYEPKKDDTYKGVYIINHTKRIYTQCKKTLVENWWTRPHILPILTADGNGRGGGDYRGTSMNLVGSWSHDLLSATMDVNTIPKRFKYVEYNFIDE